MNEMIIKKNSPNITINKYNKVYTNEEVISEYVNDDSEFKEKKSLSKLTSNDRF